MTTSIFHLEKLPAFLRRVAELNRLYVPDEALHDLLEMPGDRFATSTLWAA